MDQLQISPETQQGLQNLSAKDKQELNQFVIGETQKAQLQSSTRVFFPSLSCLRPLPQQLPISTTMQHIISRLTASPKRREMRARQ